MPLRSSLEPGAGQRSIMRAREERIQPFLEQGDLVTVLEAYSAPFPGLYLYYPQRGQASPTLRVLLDHLRQKGNGEIASSHWPQRKKM